KVSRQTINAIETYRFAPSAALALKIATVLGVRMDDIFLLEEKDWYDG
ncbi:MAG TPA: helix-turn-helix domain-containing protein, partial [Ohtaekwangia sp.]|nr:helix-turn-helix domain-containing protein [Ohtaekwangia sp.]